MASRLPDDERNYLEALYNKNNGGTAPSSSEEKQLKPSENKDPDCLLTQLLHKLYIARTLLEPVMEDIIQSAVCVAMDCCPSGCYCSKPENFFEDDKEKAKAINEDDCNCGESCKCALFGSENIESRELVKRYNVKKVIKHLKRLKGIDEMKKKSAARFFDLQTLEDLLDNLEALRDLVAALLDAMTDSRTGSIVVKQTGNTPNISLEASKEDIFHHTGTENLAQLQKEYNDLYKKVEVLKQHQEDTSSSKVMASMASMKLTNMAEARQQILDCMVEVLNLKILVEEYSSRQTNKTSAQENHSKSELYPTVEKTEFNGSGRSFAEIKNQISQVDDKRQSDKNDIWIKGKQNLGEELKQNNLDSSKVKNQALKERTSSLHMNEISHQDDVKYQNSILDDQLSWSFQKSVTSKTSGPSLTPSHSVYEGFIEFRGSNSSKGSQVMNVPLIDSSNDKHTPSERMLSKGSYSTISKHAGVSENDSRKYPSGRKGSKGSSAIDSYGSPLNTVTSTQVKEGESYPSTHSENDSRKHLSSRMGSKTGSTVDSSDPNILSNTQVKGGRHPSVQSENDSRKYPSGRKGSEGSSAIDSYDSALHTVTSIQEKEGESYPRTQSENDSRKHLSSSMGSKTRSIVDSYNPNIVSNAQVKGGTHPSVQSENDSKKYPSGRKGSEGGSAIDSYGSALHTVTSIQEKEGESYPRTHSENDSRKHLSSRMGSKTRSTVDFYGSDPNTVSNDQGKEGKHPSVQSENDSRKYPSGRKRSEGSPAKDSYGSALHTVTSIQEKEGESYPRTHSENDSRKHLSSRMGSKTRSTFDSYGSDPNTVSNDQGKEGKHPSVQSENDSRKYPSGRKRSEDSSANDSYGSALHAVTSIQEKEGESYPSTHSENDSRKYPSGRKVSEGSSAIDLYSSAVHTITSIQEKEGEIYPSIHSENVSRKYPSGRKGSEGSAAVNSYGSAVHTITSIQEKEGESCPSTHSENDSRKYPSGRKVSEGSSAIDSYSSAVHTVTSIQEKEGKIYPSIHSENVSRKYPSGRKGSEGSAAVNSYGSALHTITSIQEKEGESCPSTHSENDPRKYPSGRKRSEGSPAIDSYGSPQHIITSIREKEGESYPRAQSENDSRKHLSSSMGSKTRSIVDSYNPNIVSNAQVKEGKHPSVQSENDSRKYPSGRKGSQGSSAINSYGSAPDTIPNDQVKEGKGSKRESDSGMYPSGRKGSKGSLAIDLYGSTSNTVLNAQITEERSYPSIHTENDFKMYPSQGKEYIEKPDASRKAKNVEPNAQEGKIERSIHNLTSENEDEKESSGRKRSKSDSAGASFSSSDTQNTAIYHIVKEENIAHPHSKERSLVHSLDQVQHSFQKISNEDEDMPVKRPQEISTSSEFLLSESSIPQSSPNLSGNEEALASYDETANPYIPSMASLPLMNKQEDPNIHTKTGMPSNDEDMPVRRPQEISTSSELLLSESSIPQSSPDLSSNEEALASYDETANPYIPSIASLPLMNRQEDPIIDTKTGMPSNASRNENIIVWLSATGLPYVPSRASMPNMQRQPLQEQVVTGFVVVNPSIQIPYVRGNPSMPVYNRMQGMETDKNNHNGTRNEETKTGGYLTHNSSNEIPFEPSISSLPDNDKLIDSSNSSLYITQTLSNGAAEKHSPKQKFCIKISSSNVYRPSMLSLPQKHKDENNLIGIQSVPMLYEPSVSSIPNTFLVKDNHDEQADFKRLETPINLVGKPSIGIPYEPSSTSIPPNDAYIEDVHMEHSESNLELKLPQSQTQLSDPKIVKNHNPSSNNIEYPNSQIIKPENRINSRQGAKDCTKTTISAGQDVNTNLNACDKPSHEQGTKCGSKTLSKGTKNDFPDNQFQTRNLSPKVTSFDASNKKSGHHAFPLRIFRYRSKSFDKLKHNTITGEHRRSQSLPQRTSRSLAFSYIKSCPDISINQVTLQKEKPLEFKSICWPIITEDQKYFGVLADTFNIDSEGKRLSKLSILKYLLENQHFMTPVENSPIVMVATGGSNAGFENEDRMSAMQQQSSENQHMPRTLQELVSLIQFVQHEENQEVCTVCGIVNPFYNPQGSKVETEEMLSEGVASRIQASPANRSPNSSQIDNSNVSPKPDVSSTRSSVSWRPNNELEALRYSSNANRISEMVNNRPSQMSRISESTEDSSSRADVTDMAAPQASYRGPSTSGMSQSAMTMPRPPSQMSQVQNQMSRPPSQMTQAQSQISRISQRAESVMTQDPSRMSNVPSRMVTGISKGSMSETYEQVDEVVEAVDVYGVYAERTQSYDRNENVCFCNKRLPRPAANRMFQRSQTGQTSDFRGGYNSQDYIPTVVDSASRMQTEHPSGYVDNRMLSSVSGISNRSYTGPSQMQVSPSTVVKEVESQYYTDNRTTAAQMQAQPSMGGVSGISSRSYTRPSEMQITPSTIVRLMEESQYYTDNRTTASQLQAQPSMGVVSGISSTYTGPSQMQVTPSTVIRLMEESQYYTDNHTTAAQMQAQPSIGAVSGISSRSYAGPSQIQVTPSTARQVESQYYTDNHTAASQMQAQPSMGSVRPSKSKQSIPSQMQNNLCPGKNCCPCTKNGMDGLQISGIGASQMQVQPSMSVDGPDSQYSRSSRISQRQLSTGSKVSHPTISQMQEDPTRKENVSQQVVADIQMAPSNNEYTDVSAPGSVVTFPLPDGNFVSSVTSLSGVYPSQFTASFEMKAPSRSAVDPPQYSSAGDRTTNSVSYRNASPSRSAANQAKNTMLQDKDPKYSISRSMDDASRTAQIPANFSTASANFPAHGRNSLQSSGDQNKSEVQRSEAPASKKPSLLKQGGDISTVSLPQRDIETPEGFSRKKSKTSFQTPLLKNEEVKIYTVQTVPGGSITSFTGGVPDYPSKSSSVANEEFGSNTVSKPVDAVLPICHCRDFIDRGIFVPVPCPYEIPDIRGHCDRNSCPCDCLNVPLVAPAAKQSQTEYLPSVDTLHVLDEEQQPCTCPAARAPSLSHVSQESRQPSQAISISPSFIAESKAPTQLTAKESCSGPPSGIPSRTSMQPSAVPVTVMRGVDCCPCKTIPVSQRTTFLKNAASYGDRIRPIGQPCAATSRETVCSNVCYRDYISTVVGSGQVGEQPSPSSNVNKVLWALARVSIFDDGTRTFEILEASPIPPGHYFLPDPDEEY